MWIRIFVDSILVNVRSFYNIKFWTGLFEAKNVRKCWTLNLMKMLHLIVTRENFSRELAVYTECLGHVNLTFCLLSIAPVPTKHITYPSFLFPSLYICRVVVDPTFAGWIRAHWKFADESCLLFFIYRCILLLWQLFSHFSYSDML